MKLEEIAEIIPGSILTRIKLDTNSDDGMIVETISMQEVTNYSLGINDDKGKSVQSIDPNKKNNCIFTKKGNVIIGLTSMKAMVITEEDEGKLLLSNFALIKLDEKIIDSNYLCYFLNESKEFKKQLTKETQVTAKINVLTMQSLRSALITVPQMNTQKIIGNLYVKNLQRKSIENKLKELKEIYLLEIIENKLKKEE